MYEIRVEHCLAAAEAIKALLKEEGMDAIEEPKKEEVTETHVPAPSEEKSTLRVGFLCHWHRSVYLY